jgi:6-phosphogluconate dehydrogenase
LKNLAYIIIGVSSSGKSSIGKRLAQSLNIPFYDADDFHPESNIRKMKEGKPLNDQDRAPWLKALNTLLMDALDHTSVVLACSALKEVYRSILSKDLKNQVQWVVLDGSYELIASRMEKRSHFMPVQLLQSQFNTWEKPDYGIHLDISMSAVEVHQNLLKTIQSMNSKSDIGLIGLGVMGKSLSRNIASKGFPISVYNRHLAGVEEQVALDFVNQYPEMKGALAFDQIKAFIASLSKPRKVFLMVNAGAVVDQVIHQVLPYLEEGDIIIDGGNSHYKETQKRFNYLYEQGIHFIGTGVSGGEEGALNGPSIMPGGSSEAYTLVGPILEKIAAVDTKGSQCCSFIGKGGAGHFVKMVHNGIEYAEMQLIAEVYLLLKRHLKLGEAEIASIFETWNERELGSYLLEISANILKREENGSPLIHQILDKAGNKGTGSWTTIAACELGTPINTITAALFARYHSAFKDRRMEASQTYNGQDHVDSIDIETLRKAYSVARMINHHQGFDLILSASETYSWKINFKELARIWTNGCIIRSKLMEELSTLVQDSPNILNHPTLSPMVKSHVAALRQIVAQISHTANSYPCLSSSLQYFNACTEVQSSAHMIQAQRDYFGAHTYERIDDPSGKKYHTLWNQ